MRTKFFWNVNCYFGLEICNKNFNQMLWRELPLMWGWGFKKINVTALLIRTKIFPRVNYYFCLEKLWNKFQWNPMKVTNLIAGLGFQKKLLQSRFWLERFFWRVKYFFYPKKAVKIVSIKSHGGKPPLLRVWDFKKNNYKATCDWDKVFFCT